jgi:hypothetical protein
MIGLNMERDVMSIINRLLPSSNPNAIWILSYRPLFDLLKQNSAKCNVLGKCFPDVDE